MPTPILFLLRQVEPYSPRPWRLAETIFTSDGPRTRFLDGSWKAEEEAMAHMKELEERARAHP